MFLAIIAGPFVLVRSQDVVASMDITGNSSAFVFRGSSKKPQVRSNTANAFIAGTKLKRRIQPRAALRTSRYSSGSGGKRRTSRAARSMALTVRAEGLLDKGSVDPSIKTFRDAVAQDPRNQRAVLGLSDALSAKGIAVSAAGDETAAIKYLKEAVKLNERNDFAHAEMGEIALRSDDYDDAIKSYEMALGINPDITALNVPLGFAYVEKGNIERAADCLAKAEAGRVTDAEISNLRGLVSYHQGRNDDALAAFADTLTKDDRNATARFYRGVVFAKNGEAERSIAAYRGTVAIHPTMAEAWFDLGVQLYNSAAYDAAASAYEKVISLQPKNAQAHANLASTFRQLERFKDANAEYKLAEEGIKDDADLYSEWGFCLGKTEEWDKAVARLRTAQDLSPNAIDLSNTGWGLYNAAMAERKQGRAAAANEKLALAADSFTQAIEADPKLEAAYFNLGSTHLALGDNNAAARALEQALELRNNWVVALNQLGAAYRGKKDTSASIRQFERSLAVEPANIFALYNAGEVYVLRGDKKKARRVRDRLKPLDAALAARLDSIISGKLILEDDTRRRRN